MEKELTFIKNDFSGGLNRLDDTTKILETQYPLLVNARVRNNVVAPITRPRLQESGLPTVCKYQGVYTAGSIVLVFVGGQAFYKNYNSQSSNFLRVPGLQLSPSVDTIFVEFVPTSSRNFSRNTTVAPNGGITLGATVTQSPQCAVVQDGINQPWIVNSDGSARELQTYAQWTVNAREYVPIGKQMLYHNGILYVVSPTGTQLFRSVTGRPLDFVVAVDSLSNKVGDATTVSHAVDYASITCIKSLNTDVNALFVGTSYRSYMVVPVFESTIYGEPTFNNIPLFATGTLNQFSFIELLGDNAFITFSGVRSFNAVLQLKNEGKNSPFSAMVEPFLSNIIQDATCAINFDDYAMFSVKTVHGDAVLVYDTLRNSWAALDKMTGILGIKQFAELKITGTRKLFFITEGGLYEYFGSDKVETVGLYIGDFTSNSPNVQHKPAELHLVFTEPLEYGLIYASIFTDSLQGRTYRRYISDIVAPLPIYRGFPFGAPAQDRVRIAKFDTGREKTGWKVGAYITWTFNATLAYAQLNTITEENTENQAALLAQRVTGAVVLFNNTVVLDFNTVILGSILEIGVTDADVQIVAIRFCTTTIPVIDVDSIVYSKVVNNITYYFKQVVWTDAAVAVGASTISRISCELVLLTTTEAICVSPILLFEPIRALISGDCGITERLRGDIDPTRDYVTDPAAPPTPDGVTPDGPIQPPAVLPNDFVYLCDDGENYAGWWYEFFSTRNTDFVWTLRLTLPFDRVMTRIEIYRLDERLIWRGETWATDYEIHPSPSLNFGSFPVVIRENNVTLWNSYQTSLGLITAGEHNWRMYGEKFTLPNLTDWFGLRIFWEDGGYDELMASGTCGVDNGVRDPWRPWERPTNCEGLVTCEDMTFYMDTGPNCDCYNFITGDAFTAGPDCDSVRLHGSGSVGGGFTSAEDAGSLVICLEPGVYRYTLIAMDAHGCYEVCTFDIRIVCNTPYAPGDCHEEFLNETVQWDMPESTNTDPLNPTYSMSGILTHTPGSASYEGELTVTQHNHDGVNPDSTFQLAVGIACDGGGFWYQTGNYLFGNASGGSIVVNTGPTAALGPEGVYNVTWAGGNDSAVITISAT